MNSHRPVISAYHSYVNRKPVGKHRRVCTLLTGVFNQRSPQFHYTFVWDIEIVLIYLKTNISDNSQLPDKYLTYKFPVLLVLSSASSASSIQHLNTKFMSRNDTPYNFFWYKLYKRWRRAKDPPKVIRHTHKILSFVFLRH